MQVNYCNESSTHPNYCNESPTHPTPLVRTCLDDTKLEALIEMVNNV